MCRESKYVLHVSIYTCTYVRMYCMYACTKFLTSETPVALQYTTLALGSILNEQIKNM